MLKMEAIAGNSSMRALDVMETYRKAGRQLSLSELSRLAGIPVSTCHGVVRALQRRGFLYYLSAREAYPTRQLLDLATDIDANDPIAARLMPALTALRGATRETVIYGTRAGEAVLYLGVIEGAQTIRYSSRAGERKPLHSSAIGKAILGALPPQKLEEWLATHSLARVTERTITSARRLKLDLEASRKRGYYVTRGENVTDVMAIAVSLRRGATLLGIAVAGPLERIKHSEARVAAKLQKCVLALEQRDAGRQ
jgi:DNA-binding IclR family transcriptional regulator